jgi:hypothetical protein
MGGLRLGTGKIAMRQMRGTALDQSEHLDLLHPVIVVDLRAPPSIPTRAGMPAIEIDVTGKQSAARRPSIM